MSLQPETLHNPEEYTLLRELAHQDLLAFVQAQLRIKNSIRTVFYALNIAIVCLVALVIFLRYRNGQLQGIDVLLQASLGFALFFFILLPLHEWIHGLAYRKVGAEKVSYVAQWRKLIFYALADRFVAGKKAFYFVAFAPCVVINIILLIGFLLSGVQTEFVFLSALLLHMSGCIGDFAMVSFFHQHRHKEVYTYDDALAAKTYFYAKKLLNDRITEGQNK
ncbi:DUF3267 domain-containing protein [Rhodocytophaga rosea]|uniref:DUF3267 domain-containing protein n=1 Tax=Rhodocytophaga rosea TaxID=2704465 RepID=A0A6C0GNV7_9BACT|nr:DUF3267 domain-containing protein [Rhodocytophaga rosea]QHT69617.1 DUF3267 domain-containing protein [Rhodocytophaga rosea]